jgi:hypothetical protein
MTPRAGVKRRLGSTAAFSMIELVITTAVTAVVMSAAIAIIVPSQGIFEAQPEAADLQQRVRAAADAVMRDIMAAGAGVDTGPASGPLSDYFAPVVPYRIGDSNSDVAGGVFFRADTLSLITLPSPVAQARVTRASIVGQQLVAEAAPNCGGVPFDRLCGFTQDMRVIVLDTDGTYDIGSIASVLGLAVTVDHVGSFAGTHNSGTAMLAAVDLHTYYAKNDTATGAWQLVHYDGRVTDMPVVDELLKLEFEYFGDPSPPQLLAGTDLRSSQGPWTTYGPRPPPLDVDNDADDWPAGENCVFRVNEGAHVPRLATLSGTVSDVKLDAATLTDGPWCPDGASPARYDADLLRLRRVRVTMRFEAAAASLRGPVSTRFQRGGTATSSTRLVPDVETRFDVTPRNVSLSR